MSETPYAEVVKLLPGIPKLKAELERLGFVVTLDVDRLSEHEFFIGLTISNYPIDIDLLQEKARSVGLRILIDRIQPPLSDDEIPF